MTLKKGNDMTKISPSVLACDLSNLANEVKEIERCGADMVHLDVMDGMFVTNISFGLPVIQSLRDKTDLIFDVHLMIEEPERYADRFIEAGADILTFHLEACKDPVGLLQSIRAQGVMAGISIKPGTDVGEVFPLLEECDMVLVMTVEPGYGGQKLIPETLEKVSKIRAEIENRSLSVEIQVDGGINSSNAPMAISAGASILVAGSSVFGAADKKAAIESLRNAN